MLNYLKKREVEISHSFKSIHDDRSVLTGLKTASWISLKPRIGGENINCQSNILISLSEAVELIF